MDSFPEAKRDAPLIDADQVGVYEQIVRSGSISSASLRRELGISTSRIDSAVRALLGLHLIRRAPTAEEEWIASSPSMAVAALVTPLEEELRQYRRYVDALKELLDGLIPTYFSAQTGRDLLGVELVDDARAMRSLLAHSVHQCQSDVLIAHPGEDFPADLLTHGNTATALSGVRIRSLHHRTARSHRGTRALVEWVTALGTEARITEETFSWLVVFDRRIAFLPGGRHGMAVVVRQPAVVDFICDTFERAWRSGRPLPEPHASNSSARASSGASEEMERAIVQLLVAGEKDEVIARRLGIAVRTCRRYIAVLMQRLGAESRFQAGYLAGQADLLAVSPEEQPESGDRAP